MRHPPQTNYPPDTVPGPDSWSQVRIKNIQGWYLTGARRLPPILNMHDPNSMSSYSKASRGLFVRLRLTSIFTRLAISPSPSLRQCSSCYAIRAGRNLPDKEFRYLRTVIVTAGVHPRLISELRTEVLTHPLNVRTLARRHPLYILLRVSRELCFW